MSHSESLKTRMIVKFELRDEAGNLIESGFLDPVSHPYLHPPDKGGLGGLGTEGDLNAPGKTINNMEEP